MEKLVFVPPWRGFLFKAIYGILRSMKVLLTSLLILSFLGVSALSFATMYHQGSGNEDCVAEMAAGLNCPVNPLAFADFHLNLFRGFSSAYFSDFFSAYLSLITLLFFGLIFDLFGHNSFGVGRANHYGSERIFESFTPLVKIKNSHWLSLHENSPTSH